MKALLSFVASLSGLAFAATPADRGAVPGGLAACDRADIRAAYEAGKHAPYRQEDGHFLARNPGQQWTAEFDGKGFTVTPDHGAWTWGLALTGYGNSPLSAATAQLRQEGGRITCRRDDNLTEWFINDTRGLEQGWDIRQRPARTDPAAPLLLHLSTRGSVQPLVSGDGGSVFFQKDGGGGLTYGGLKAWDAAGKDLPVRFESSGERGIRIAVEDQSARYPITIDPLAQQTFLQASNKDYRDHFGEVVAISGDTVVVAARNEASAATGVNGDQTSNTAYQSGAVYVFVRSGTTWIQQAYLKASNAGQDDWFGTSVAISGDTLVVGSLFEGSAATGVNGDQTSTGAASAGAAYVFVRNGTTWTQQAYLKASNTAAQDRFGSTVGISGDTIVVGAPGEDNVATGVNGNQNNRIAHGELGAAYVFTRSGTTWTQQAYLKASNTDGQDQFGSAVAISGDTVVVAAKEEDSAATGVNGDQTNNAATSAGAAYVFVRSGTTWTQQAYLKASNTDAFDFFGEAIAISGDSIVVGASWEASNAKGVNGDQSDDSTTKAGAAYIFTRNGTTWTQQAYLKASNTEYQNAYYGSFDLFGDSVAISGDTVVVGAPLEDSNASGVNGDQNNNNGGDSGAAYVFSRSGTTWTQRAYLKAGNVRVSDQFGYAVAIAGDTVVTGVPYKDYISGDDAGAAYITDLSTGPEIFVQQAGTSVASGGTRSFGTVAGGAPAEIVFDLYNLGSADLTLSGTPKVVVTGSGDFTVSSQPASPVTASGGSTSFTAHFAPTSDGLKSATLTILSNDPDEAAYVIHLSGTGNTGTGTAYQLWETSQGIAGAGPDADSDQDGISNSIEYVIGGDPSGPDSDSRALLPVITRDSSTLTCVFRRTHASLESNPAAVAYSSNLTTDWVTARDGVGGVSIVEENDGFGAGVDKVTVSIPVAGKTTLFARLLVDVQ